MPDWKNHVRAAVAHLNLDPGREESIVEELAEHLDDQYVELVRSGVSEAAAYRKVLEDLNKRKLGVELRPLFQSEPLAIAPGAGHQRGFLTGLGKDLRLGVRLLRLNPAFAIVAILSLALGIGANTAIFELIDTVVLRTLPVPAPERLAELRLIHDGRIGSSVARQHEVSSAMWEQLQRQQRSFSSVAAWSSERFNLGNGGEARYADGLWVSDGFFDTLQVRPTLGRLFSTSDDYKGCNTQGIAISYAFWQGELGGREDVLGRSLSLNGRSFPIIGVTSRIFSGLEVGRKFDVALPLCMEPVMHAEDAWTNGSTTWWLAVIGRLRPEFTFERASAQLASVSPGIFAATLPMEYDEVARRNYLRFRFRALPAATGVSDLRNDYEYPLWLLLAISAVVLLIACANMANLLLARASVRQHEMALRMAIGASRPRLVRQLLVESLLLATAGAVLGGVLAHALCKALIAAIGTGQDRVFLSLSVDWRLLAFTAGLAALTCLVFGVAPAFHAANTEPGAVVKTSARGLTGGRQRLLFRRGLIVSQMAFSLVLVITALFFVRTFRNLVSVDTGFRQDHILVADFDLSPLKLPVQSRLEYKRDLMAQVRTTPGVVSAAETAIVPLSGNGWNDFIDIPGTDLQRKLANFSEVSSDYFRTLGVPMLAGRDFNGSDTLKSPGVAIVNLAFANAYLGGGDSLGKAFGVRQDGGKPDKPYRVIGVVGNTKYGNLREPFGPIVFVAGSQDAATDLDSTVMIRSNEDLASLIPSLRMVAAKNNPRIVLNFSVLRTSIRRGLRRESLMAALSGAYGALAAVLSIVGLYGILSYTVTRRTSEIGIRMALGASRNRILGMIVQDALTMLGVGVALGTVLAIAAGRAVQTILFGLKPTDPLSLGLAITGMTVVALAASLIPALRAAAVQPIQTLREE